MSSRDFTDADALSAALRWHLDAGADAVFSQTPANWADFAAAPPASSQLSSLISDLSRDAQPRRPPQAQSYAANPPHPGTEAIFSPPSSGAPLPSLSALTADAAQRARNAATREALREALDSFDGLAIKRTATHLVFSDGNPAAHVMIVGEAPGADEDRLGRPFVGVSGQLLDKMFECIGLSRTQDAPDKALYISNILNWRPPGNRTPSDSEVEISLPFIEKHIVLIRPRLLILAGGVSAKALLGTNESVSRLRGRWHEWSPKTPGIAPETFPPIPALATFHPSYLLRTPLKKRESWADLRVIHRRLSEKN